MMVSMRNVFLKAAALSALIMAAPAWAQETPPQGLKKLKHIIVLYEENRSFDAIFGLFPGATGVADAGAAGVQVGLDDRPLKTLPPVMDTRQHPAIPDPRFPTDLPNRPFLINPYAGLDQMTGDLVHRFYQEQQQIDGGKMDRFAIVSDAGGLTMGYYDSSALKIWQIAKNYTLADHLQPPPSTLQLWLCYGA